VAEPMEGMRPRRWQATNSREGSMMPLGSVDQPHQHPIDCKDSPEHYPHSRDARGRRWAMAGQALRNRCRTGDRPGRSRGNSSPLSLFWDAGGLTDLIERFPYSGSLLHPPWTAIYGTLRRLGCLLARTCARYVLVRSARRWILLSSKTVRTARHPSVTTALSPLEERSVRQSYRPLSY
jgi:hypothetical protein